MIDIHSDSGQPLMMDSAVVTVKVISSESRGSSCEKSTGGPKLGAKCFLQILTFQRSDLDHRPQRRFSA